MISHLRKIKKNKKKKNGKFTYQLLISVSYGSRQEAKNDGDEWHNEIK